jgi:hypothetical protein
VDSPVHKGTHLEAHIAIFCCHHWKNGVHAHHSHFARCANLLGNPLKNHNRSKPHIAAFYLAITPAPYQSPAAHSLSRENAPYTAPANNQRGTEISTSSEPAASTTLHYQTVERSPAAQLVKLRR